MRFRQGLYLACLWFMMTFGMSIPAFHSDGRILYVDDDDPSCGGFSPCYQTIQDAVTAAQSGDTIKVRPGTYTGQIGINKSLKISGESKDLVFIKNASTEGPGNWGIIRITGSISVKLEDLTILDGAIGVYIIGQNTQVAISRTWFSKHAVAILLSDGQIVLLNSQISQNEFGVLIGTESPLPNRIERNQFQDNSVAISIRNESIVVINDNEFMMNETGLEIKGSAKVIVQANAIKGNRNGVQVYDVAQVHLEGNQFADNALNGVIVRGFSRATLVRNQVLGNGLQSDVFESFFFYDPFFGFIGQKFSPQGFGAAVGDAAIADFLENRIEGNLFGLGASHSLDPNSKELVTPQLNAQQNQIIGNGWGVWLRGAEATLSNNEIAHNDITALPGVNLNLLFVNEVFPSSGVLIQAGHPLIEYNRIAQNALGVVLQEQASPTLRNNQITSNTGYGIALYLQPCFDLIPPILAFQGEVLGEANELSGNSQDLCPPDYPWPPGFRK